MSFILNAINKAETEKQQRQVPSLSAVHGFQREQRIVWNTWKIAIAALLVINLILGALFSYRWLAAEPVVEVPTNPYQDLIQVTPYVNQPKGEYAAMDFNLPRPQPKAVEASTTAAVAASQPQAESESALLAEPSVLQQSATAEQPEQAQQDFSWDLLPTIHDLPNDWQQEVPRLSFAAHVYSEKQGASFVIINGQLMNEGDKFGKVSLIKITEQGAVFEVFGTLFKAKFG